MTEVKDTWEPGIDKVDAPAPLTMEQLATMLIKTQADLAASQQQLASAILEARKPYVDPSVLKGKQDALAERQRQIAADQRQKELTKKACPHTRENGTSNIKWMEHSSGIILGVCGTCISQFDARKSSDLELLRKDLKALKNMGRAGNHARRNAN